MSGDITQRGEIAIKDKYTRASWAIKAGCNMVCELAPQYSVASAQIFATGASKIISLFSGEKLLAFGSECGDLDSLKKIANAMQSKVYIDSLKAHIKTGITYASASELALCDVVDSNLVSLLNKPNNTLAIEYLKAVDSSVEFFTIKRDGSYDDSLDKLNPSARSIRELLLQNKDISLFVPPFVLEDLNDVKNTKELLFSIIKYQLPKIKDMDKIFGIQEGLNNRILSSLKNASTFDQFIANIKTKRYTYTTICRAIINCLLENYSSFDSLIDDPLEYVNVLAINKEDKDLLSIISSPIITKPSDIKKNNLDDLLMQSASRLFYSINGTYEPFMRII